MEIRDILKRLAPLKNRMHINRGVYRLLLCICIGAACAMLISYASLLFPIPYVFNLIINVYLISAVTGLIFFAFSAPGTENLIKRADALGLKERVMTAWQLKNENSPIALIQREDTYKSVLNTDFRLLYPVLFPKRLGLVLCAFIILTTVSSVIPAYARDSARKIEELKNVVEEQLKEIEKAEEDLKNEGKLSQDELDKLNEELKKLTEELKEAKTEDEALKALKRAENQLEKLDIKKQLAKLGEMLRQYEMTEELGESIANSNAEDMKQALEQLKSKMEQEEISPEELKTLFDEAKEQIDDKELSEALSKALEGLSEEDLEGAIKSLESLGQTLSELMEAKSVSSMSKATGKLLQALEIAKGRISKVDNSTNQNGAISKNGTPSDNSAGQSQSQGNKEGQSQNPASGPGEGNKGTGGAGDGTTNKDDGNTGKEQQGGGRKPGDGREEEYEKLYDPEYLGGGADPSHVSGQIGEGGESSYSQNNLLPSGKGAVLPYNEVLKKYISKASSYMEDADIPAAMKDIVRQYFESLD